MVHIHGYIWICVLTFIGTTSLKQIYSSGHMATSCVYPRLNIEEYNALYTFYNATNGYNWTWSTSDGAYSVWNFSTGENPCENWQGKAYFLNKTTGICLLTIHYYETTRLVLCLWLHFWNECDKFNQFNSIDDVQSTRHLTISNRIFFVFEVPFT